MSVLLVAPAVATPLAVLFDRGPRGESRISSHFFPVALWLFDDFAWTCARNSIVFAIVVSLLSLIIGASLGWAVGRGHFWGRAILSGSVLALLAVSPAFLALGLGGLLGSPRPWPWPWQVDPDGPPGVGLESWRGITLWTEWIWTTLPWGVALVTFATAAKVEQLEPSWSDAARLAGVRSFRVWRALLWPVVRPSSARAAALVFVFALTEPGAPLVLGLRRTLAFQLVAAAGRPDPFPAAAVWALMTGLFGLVGFGFWRWSGGPFILGSTGHDSARATDRGVQSHVSRKRALIGTLLLAGWALIGWLPLVGLVQLAIGGDRAGSLLTGDGWRAVKEHARHFSDPSVTQIVANSIVLGLEVAVAAFTLFWLAGPPTYARRKSPLGGRLVRLIGSAPPLLQGLGLLAFSWLAGLGSSTVARFPAWRQLATVLGMVQIALDPARHPWFTLSFCVALSIVPRLLWLVPGDLPTAPTPRASRSNRDAALLAGFSKGRSTRLGQPQRRVRWLCGAIVAGALAATNLTPALLFETWTSGRTLAPAVVLLAAGSPDVRSLAAALALCGIAINMAAVALARATLTCPGSANDQ